MSQYLYFPLTKITMFPDSEQVQDIELYRMNFWYIEHYGACFGDDIDAKMNYYKDDKLFNVY